MLSYSAETCLALSVTCTTDSQNVVCSADPEGKCCQLLMGCFDPINILYFSRMPAETRTVLGQ